MKSEAEKREVRAPAMQNIPIRTELGMEIRRAFILVSVDHQPASADYSRIEPQLLAHTAAERKQ